MEYSLRTGPAVKCWGLHTSPRGTRRLVGRATPGSETGLRGAGGRQVLRADAEAGAGERGRSVDPRGGTRRRRFGRCGRRRGDPRERRGRVRTGRALREAASPGPAGRARHSALQSPPQRPSPERQLGGRRGSGPSTPARCSPVGVRVWGSPRAPAAGKGCGQRLDGTRLAPAPRSATNVKLSLSGGLGTPVPAVDRSLAPRGVAAGGLGARVTTGGD